MFVERLTELTDTRQSPEWLFYERHFAPTRMAHYLKEFDGDAVRARALYGWNNEISAGFWEVLAYLEVALRNTIDCQMKARRLAAGDQRHWLMSENPNLIQLNSRLGKDLEEAKRRVLQNGKELTGEQMLSELSFNFWTLMIANKTKRYWPDLAGGFLCMPNRSSKELSELLNEVRNFRDRIGHHHRIWNFDLASMNQKILRIAEFIDPEFQAWLNAKSRVERLLKLRP